MRRSGFFLSQGPPYGITSRTTSGFDSIGTRLERLRSSLLRDRDDATRNICHLASGASDRRSRPQYFTPAARSAGWCSRACAWKWPSGSNA